MPLLNPGDRFPPITITPVDGAAVELPDALAGHFGVILFNRGSWCPYCNAQLRAFQREAEKLDGLDVKVVSLSVDDEDTARELIAKHGLTFPSVTTPTLPRYTKRPARSSTPTRRTCSPPGSSSIPTAT